MCVIFRIYSDPSSDMNKNMISLHKTNSCLLENNTKVLSNDEADVNNQMSRKYKEENIRFQITGIRPMAPVPNRGSFEGI